MSESDDGSMVETTTRAISIADLIAILQTYPQDLQALILTYDVGETNEWQYVRVLMQREVANKLEINV